MPCPYDRSTQIVGARNGASAKNARYAYTPTNAAGFVTTI